MSQLTTDVTCWAEQHQKECRSRKDAAAQTLKAYLGTLANVEEIVVNYDGSGDDGAITSIKFFDHAGTEVHPPPADVVRAVVQKLQNQEFDYPEVEDYIYALLAARFGGWENDDGAYGEIVIRVEDGSVDVAHDERVMSTHSHEEQDQL